MCGCMFMCIFVFMHRPVNDLQFTSCMIKLSLLYLCACGLMCGCEYIVVYATLLASAPCPITLFLQLQYREGFPTIKLKKKKTPPLHHAFTHIQSAADTTFRICQFVACLPVTWQIWQTEVEADWLAPVQVGKALCPRAHSRWMTQ